MLSSRFCVKVIRLKGFYHINNLFSCDLIFKGFFAKLDIFTMPRIAIVAETAFIVPAIHPIRLSSHGSLRTKFARCEPVRSRFTACANSSIGRSLQSYRSGERFRSSERRLRPSPVVQKTPGKSSTPEEPPGMTDEVDDSKEGDASRVKGTEGKASDGYGNNEDASCSNKGPNHSGPKKGSQISLLKALVRLKVASEDTCLFLVRHGYVSVNGVVVEEARAPVNCVDDKINVKGREFGTVSNATPPVIDEKDRKSIPRPHRSRSRDEVEDIKQNHRSIDGGFYARRRRMYGK